MVELEKLPAAQLKLLFDANKLVWVPKDTKQERIAKLKKLTIMKVPTALQKPIAPKAIVAEVRDHLTTRKGEPDNAYLKKMLAKYRFATGTNTLIREALAPPKDDKVDWSSAVSQKAPA